MTQRVARVLIDSPLPQLDRLFDYLIPHHLAADTVQGVRVKVPLRSVGRIIDAYVVEVVDSSESDRPLSEIDSVVSGVQVLPERLYRLARKVADRAAGSASDVLRLVVPKRQVRVEKQWLASPTAAPATLSVDALSYAQTVLADYPGLAEAVAAGERVAFSAFAHPTTTAEGTSVGAWAMQCAALCAVGLSRGESVIVVVPDYRDQDALHAALQDLVPADSIVRADAKQSAPERYRGYVRALEDAPAIVIGNRSAVYWPVQAACVIVWDDGDTLLDEPLAPYVHPRDAALIRQELTGCALVFAGHTRTTDVERLIGIGYVREIQPQRAYSPHTIVPALNEQEFPGTRIPSSAYRAVREALAEGPVLVQVSRPGYAPVLVCAGCRAPAKCLHCGGPLHAKTRGAPPTCRWCGRIANGWRCPQCQSDRVRLASSGSERTADDLGRAFPKTRVIVADGEHPVQNVDASSALIVATRGAEPIAAGGYRAVLLLDGERMLMGDDLRVTESCLRWWSNAAALAAPGAPVLLTGVGGAVATAFTTWTQPAFAQNELAERAPLRMPPMVRVAQVEGDQATVTGALTELRAAVPTLNAEAILGPLAIENDQDGRVRALVRFDYGSGTTVMSTLRASVVAAAVAGRRRGRGRNRATLRVRADVSDPQL